MTLDELIKKIDIYLPGNRFDNDMKTAWLNEIEGKIFDEIETIDFKPAGSEVRYVSRDADGKYVYHSKKIDTLPESLDEEEEEETAGETAFGIDPLNMGCCYANAMCGAWYELIPYKYETDAETELIVPDRFSDVYVHYILAKMHQADSEIDNYNNEVLLFTASYDDYAAYKIRHYR